jgi:hypothetical protein
MAVSRIGPKEYLLERIEILESQIEEIDAEMLQRRADNVLILDALKRAKNSYASALLDENKLSEISLGKDYSERRQRMHQIIRGVNTGIFDEIRVFRSFAKSLNAEKRQIQRELSLLRLRARLLDGE